MANENYTNTMTSFSGADLQVAFGNRVIGELQSISWAVQRQKVPVYTLGSADPRSFSRGLRGVAGSLVFAIFDRDALISELKSVWNDIAPNAMFTAKADLFQRENNDFNAALGLADWNETNSNAQETGSSRSEGGEAVQAPDGFGIIKYENVMYADMLPPFDVTMTFANEYGQAAFQKIYDVDILNEGSGVSVDSTIMERQMTFIARRISPIMKGVYHRDSASK